jgi:transposase
MKPIRVPDLSPEQLTDLEELYRSTRKVRLRTRAQMVLLAAERSLTAKGDLRDRPRQRGDGASLAQTLPGRGGRASARRTATGSAAQGDAGVPRGADPRGPPPSPQPGVAVLCVWTLQRLADYMAESTGIRVSYETVRVHLKIAGIVLSRPQHTITSPDPEYALKKRRSRRLATASTLQTTSTMPTSST